MSESLRGRLFPLVLCCVSGGLGLHASRAQAQSMAPLYFDPALFKKAPVAGQAPESAQVQAPYPVSKSAAAVAEAYPATAKPVAGAPSEGKRDGAALATAPATQRPGVAMAAPTGDPAAPGPNLKMVKRLAPVPADDQPRPNFVSGGRIRTVNADTTIIEENAELRRQGLAVAADRIIYRRNQDEVEAEGAVRVDSGGSTVSGSKMLRRLDAQTGYFDQPTYAVRKAPVPGQQVSSLTGYGRAEKLDFLGEAIYRLKNATYTTCGPSNPDWYLKAGEINLDENQSEGVANQATIYFKDQPIFYSPWVDFALNNDRKSGFLTPSLGSNSKTGLDVTAPWYWNIAPNRDATFTPHYMGKRGLQLGTEFRYLEPNYSGTAKYEVLPHDEIYGGSRKTWSLVHNQDLGLGLSAALNLNGASDKSYFADFSSSISDAAQSYLTKNAALAYRGTWWSANIGTVRYNPLQDVAVTYAKQPYFNVSAYRPDVLGGVAAAVNWDYAKFVIDDPAKTEGQRTVIYPQISYPVVTSGVTVVPKLGAHLTRYSNLSNVQTPLSQTSLSRSIPIVSVDATAVLERDAEWGGKNMLQTLEPRLYYLRVPYRDQSNLPVFDTALADFNFAQIFSENRYAGSDRVGDANQVTAALTSRLVDPQTGTELMRGMVGQIYYLGDQKVTLPTEVARTSHKSDFLGAINGQFLPYSWLDLAWRYNVQSKLTDMITGTARYQPEPLKSLSLGYRLRRDTAGTTDGIRDVDMSGQWPLWGRWYGVGRYDYSIRDKALIEAVGGLEYDGGCWVGRVVAHRYVTANQLSSVNTNYTSGFFIQLEFNGFSRLGTDPLDLLKRNISGYGRINSINRGPVYGAE